MSPQQAEISATRPTKSRGPRRQPNLELKALRLNAGLSMEALGLRINVSRETVRLAELGYLPGPRVQFALAREFDRRPLDLWPMDRQRSGR